jgi:hypothetical protein
MSEPTNAAVLADALKDFEGQEDYSQEVIADNISEEKYKAACLKYNLRTA